jgi:hypothetical protein
VGNVLRNGRAHADGHRLSYCADCDVVKARAQGRGYSVAQMCDAFERNTVHDLFGSDYDFIIGGTRFDPSAAQWAVAAEPAPLEVAAGGVSTSLLARPQSGVQAAGGKRSADGAATGAGCLTLELTF